MNFFIRKNSSSIILDYEVNYISSEFIHDSVCKFSMKNKFNNVYKILDKDAKLIENTNNVILRYTFDKIDTKEVGDFVGEFIITKGTKKLILPIEDVINITISDSIVDNKTFVKVRN